jgi:hypothetical protein
VGYEVIRQAVKTEKLIEEFSPYGVPIPEEAAKGDGFPVVTLTVGVSRKYGRQEATVNIL